MKRIFQNLYHSLYDFKWLSQRRSDGKSGAVNFFIATFLFSVIAGVFLCLNIIGLWNDAKVFFNDQVPYFKADLKDGILLVSEIEQPFTREVDGFKIVVDTRSSSTVKVTDLTSDQDKIVVLVTNEEVSAYNSEQNKIETRLFKDMSNGSVDKNEILSSLNNFHSVIFVFVFLFMVFLFIAFSLANAFFLFFWSFIVWVVSAFAKKDWKYLEIVSAGSFAIVLPIFIRTISTITAFKPPFLPSLIFLVYMLFIVFAASHKEGEIKK